MSPSITCLVIDDDEDDQEFFLLALRKMRSSLTCQFANDGQEALEKLKKDTSFSPNYIFLDLNMPGMSGKQCLTEIKKIAHLQHTPIFIYSTSSDSRDIAETRRLGADEFITKPTQVNLLTDQLSKLFMAY